MIRPYVTADGPQLVTIHNSVYPDSVHTTSSFGDYVAGTRALGGFVWVIGNPAVVGYGSVTPVPGLPGIAELAGCIAVDQQRKGLGSRLLTSMLDKCRDSNIRQVTFSVDRLESPAASFLRQHYFFAEHEEWIMMFGEMAMVLQENCPGPVKLQTYARQTAVSLFCRLYEESFSGLAWDQPYSELEVVERLDHADELLFLMLEGQAVGFAWTKLDSEGRGVVEPLGIVPTHQNRGYGRCLLTSAMRVLVNRGAKRIEIGAWRDNEKAIELYRSLGFQRYKTITYLAFNLAD